MSHNIPTLYSPREIWETAQLDPSDLPAAEAARRQVWKKMEKGMTSGVVAIGSLACSAAEMSQTDQPAFAPLLTLAFIWSTVLASSGYVQSCQAIDALRGYGNQ